MTKDTAVSLIREYSKIFKEKGLSETASELSDRWPEDGSERKAMRWLGFAQGVAWHTGIFTLDELKEHSRKGCVAPMETAPENRTERTPLAPPPPILARFRLTTSLHKNYFVDILSKGVWQVPQEGSIINLNGNPFHVRKVGWAFSDENEISFAFVEVLKAGQFKLVLGGKEY